MQFRQGLWQTPGELLGKYSCGCRARIAFKLVWTPPHFTSFVLVDDSRAAQVCLASRF